MAARQKIKRSKRRHKATEPQQQWVGAVTGKDRKYWVALVQKLIAKHSRPTKDPWHGVTATAKVIEALVKEIVKTYPKQERFDENMRMAAVLSYILATWYARVHRAKSYDPRRPVRLRKDAFMSRQRWAVAMFQTVIDESEDAEMFPGQKWETPWDPNPTDGFFT